MGRERTRDAFAGGEAGMPFPHLLCHARSFSEAVSHKSPGQAWYPRPDSNRRYRLERAAC
jgi:hypothetical protein